MTDYSQKGQLELGLQRAREKDRNFHLGGRSFYFFDFDDNIAFLPTPLVVFDKKTGAEHYLTSGEWALYHAQIGYSGPFKDFEIRFDDKSGSFRYFRDHTAEELARLGRQKQIFIDDILPFNYNEQLKIPIKHYYENGILKYGENWTGDVWKVVYHIIKYFKHNISSIKYFYNINFRGIAAIKIKERFQIIESDIDVINSYDYFECFSDYIKELQLVSL
jgi:hypothetical protein